MKTVAVAAALTGSCAVLYLLYTMKVHSKERRTSKKNKANGLQSSVHKRENVGTLNDLNSSSDHTDTTSKEQNGSSKSNITETESSKSAQEEMASLSHIEAESIPVPPAKTDLEVSNSCLQRADDSEGMIPLSSTVNSLSEVTDISKEIGIQNLVPLNSECDFIKIKEESSSGVLDLHLQTTEEIQEESSPINSENTEIKEDTTSISTDKCDNLFEDARDIITPIDNDVKNLTENYANTCHINLSQEVPEKDISDDIQLSTESECTSSSKLDNADLVAENKSNENSLTESLVKPNTVSDLSENVQTNFIKSEEINQQSSSPKTVSDAEKDSTNSDEQSCVTEEEKPVAKSKKQRQKERKRAAKAKLNNVSPEVTNKPQDAILPEKSNKPKTDSTETLPCKPDIKEGFWSIKETKNVENDSKLLACSPDHVCTSDLEREASQTPEHENVTSDSQSLISQASYDSGQGSIDQETIFSNMILPEDDSDYYITYQFEVPQTLVGKLIGKRGAFLNKLKATTSTNIVVVNYADEKYKLCSVEGKKGQVLQALDLIRDHFPSDQFPELNLAQVNAPSPQHQPEMNRQLLEVELPPGVVLEVQASAVISTGEVWLQQPLHPTFSALHRLHQCLNLNYGDGSTTPTIPLTIPTGTVCVCQIGDQWLRCQVLDHDGVQSTVCLLDIGGDFCLPFTQLRQIRVDYVSLPFQATRCYLHGIEPTSENGWEEDGRLALLQLSKNNIIYATIAAYSQDGIPLVNLYQRQFNQYTFINEKLVEMGHAKWISGTTVLSEPTVVEN